MNRDFVYFRTSINTFIRVDAETMEARPSAYESDVLEIAEPLLMNEIALLRKAMEYCDEAHLCLYDARPYQRASRKSSGDRNVVIHGSSSNNVIITGDGPR